MVNCSAYYLKTCVQRMQKGIDENDSYSEILNFGKLLGIRSCGKNKIDREIANFLIDLYCREDGAFMYFNAEAIDYNLTLSNYKEKLNVLG